MAEGYARQKGQSYARFKIDSADAARISSGQFTIFDFITNCFLFSPKKKQLSISFLEALSSKPLSFNELVSLLKARKSTVYLLCLSLERSGFIRKQGRKFELSNEFSQVARVYAGWWENWVERNRLK